MMANPIANMVAAMRDFSRPRLWLGIWVFGWLLCVVLSLIPPLHIGVAIEDSDKIGHFLAYTTLSTWAVMIFERRGSWAWAALALVLLGVCMELAQGAFTDNRLMDTRDAVANTLGVLSGLCVGLTPMRTLLQYIERRWLPRR